MIPDNINDVNRHLANASLNLIEAAKYLSNIPEFRDEALKISRLANALIEVIEPQKEKITDEKLDSVLEDILNA
mgnify:CR=1 FL=1|jgi:hypothetical protein